jgi:RNA polymerase sigma factor (sigma-70 family)
VPQQPDEKKVRVPALSVLANAAELMTSLYEQSGAARWGVSAQDFAQSLERGAAKRFPGGSVSPAAVEEFLLSLHLEDLALALGCQQGSEPAWNYFYENYRGYLRSAAGAIAKGSTFGANPHELADSLFADLFGLADGRRGEQSLFRYFHGRSALKTWLRTVLAQRYVDRVRASKRWEPLEKEDGTDGGATETGDKKAPLDPLPDPHRDRYVASFAAALQHCLQALDPKDRERLELYYAREKKLAEIGKLLGEHESSVSRNLDRVRRELHSAVEQRLRDSYAMSDAQIQMCIEYAAEDVPLDFRRVFPEEPQRPARRKEPL